VCTGGARNGWLRDKGRGSQIRLDDTLADRRVARLTQEQLARMVRLRDVGREVPVSVRLDPQVLDWLRAKGAGHLTRINNILTNLMEAERRAGLG
jgi:hypothetical protein